MPGVVWVVAPALKNLQEVRTAVVRWAHRLFAACPRNHDALRRQVLRLRDSDFEVWHWGVCVVEVIVRRSNGLRRTGQNGLGTKVAGLHARWCQQDSERHCGRSHAGCDQLDFAHDVFRHYLPVFRFSRRRRTKGGAITKMIASRPAMTMNVWLRPQTGFGGS